MNNHRSESLDALRGLAILMMILSGAIPFDGMLPGWMYHAQTPPPAHIFNPLIPGITWVDLVFPFFIFSMGTAIPFAMKARKKKGHSNTAIMGHIFFRWIALSLFAFFVYYIRPWVISAPAGSGWWLSLTGFILLSASFIKLPADIGWKKINNTLNICGVALLLILLFTLNRLGYISLSLNNYDIIIMILASISLFGGIIQLVSGGSTIILAATWLFAALFYIMAKFSGGLFLKIWSYSPASWLVSWEYIKYLLVLIPGMWAGNQLSCLKVSSANSVEEKAPYTIIIPLLLLSVLIVITSGLYMRKLMPVIVYCILALSALYPLNRILNRPINPLIGKLLSAGTLFTLAGLLLEPLQGGIKKDPATLSYLVLTPGMAILMLVIFVFIIDIMKIRKPFFLLSGSGKNAMLAYYTGSNLISPLFALTGINALLMRFSDQPLWLTIKAVIITLGVGLISTLAAGKKFIIKA